MNTRPILLVLLAVAAVSGCGYSTEPLLATADNGEPIRSVAVAIVANDSHRRQYEEPLTDAILKEIQASTNLVVKKENQNPDSVLRLQLTDVQEYASIENRLDVVTQGTVEFSILVEWTDHRTGEKIPLLQDLARDSRRFTVTRGESFATAAAEIAEKIAEKIVENMYRGMQ